MNTAFNIMSERIPRRKLAKVMSSHDLLVVRPHWLSQLSKFILAIVLILFVEYLALAYPVTLIPVWKGLLFGAERTLSIPILHLVPLLLVISALHALYDEKYLIDKEGVIEIIGLLSLRVRRIQLHYHNIRASEVEQAQIQRIFDIGSVKLGTVVTTLGEISMHGIKNPYLYQSIIEGRIKRHQEAD